MSGFTLAILSFSLVLATVVRWAMLVGSVSIPKNRSVYVFLMAIGTGLGIAAFVLGTGNWIANIGAGLAIFIGGFFLMLFTISGQKGGSGKFQVGSALPSFSALDENGELFEIDSLAGQPIMLKFFRGHW